MNIISATTPTITFNFSEVDPAEISVAYLIIKIGGTTVIEKDLLSATVDETSISWTLTQEETLLLKPAGIVCRICCDWKTNNGTRGRSKVGEYKIEESGKQCVI